MAKMLLMAKLKKVMYYLGLSADEEYAGYDEPADPYTEGFTYETDPTTDVPLEPVPTAVPDYSAESGESYTGLEPLSQNSPTVRLMPQAQNPKVQVLTPRTFQEVKEIGENLSRDKPIIINLQETQQDISRRIVDFASGVCFALGGQMERVADLVYLLVPPDVEINPEDRHNF